MLKISKDNYYPLWYDRYENNLIHLFSIFQYHIKEYIDIRKNKEESYNNFCLYIFNNSNKLIC